MGMGEHTAALATAATWALYYHATRGEPELVDVFKFVPGVLARPVGRWIKCGRVRGVRGPVRSLRLRSLRTGAYDPLVWGSGILRVVPPWSCVCCKSVDVAHSYGGCPCC